MTHYSIYPRSRIFVNENGFLSFAVTMLKNIGKRVSKNVSSKYNQNFLIIRNKE